MSYVESFESRTHNKALRVAKEVEEFVSDLNGVDYKYGDKEIALIEIGYSHALTDTKRTVVEWLKSTGALQEGTSYYNELLSIFE